MNNMPLPEDLAELRRLIHALHEQCITPEESAQLEAWVCRDKEARRVYVQYMNLYAGVRWRLTQGLSSDQPLSNGKSQPSRAPILGFLGDVLQAGADFLSQSFVLTLLLAIGLPGIVLLVLVLDVARQPVAPAPVARAPVAPAPVVQTPVAPAPAAVAEMTASHRCVWEGENAQLAMGTKFLPGEELRLREGLAELAFTSGARVILQGPAAFRVGDEKNGFLAEGALAATVPPPAQGCTVQTPLASVVDLGTEFGVRVAPDGTAEAHVFQGRVLLGTPADKGAPESFQELNGGQAAKIHRTLGNDRPQTELIAAASDRFVRRLPPATNVGLPEPKVVFAHYGSRDPLVEGWVSDEIAKGVLGGKGCRAEPIDDAGTAAWSISDSSQQAGLGYRHDPTNGLSPELIAKARAQGWVLRARFKAVGIDNSSAPGGVCVCSCWATDRDFTMRADTHPDGTQTLCLIGESSAGHNARIPIPDSRDRYVDYELRYNPKTNDADIYVNGKLMVTGYYRARVSQGLVLFGVFKTEKCDMRVARVEWGILEP